MKIDSPPSGSKRRLGFTIVEAIVSLVLISTLCATLIPLLAKLQTIQQQREDEFFREQILLNLVESLNTQPQWTNREELDKRLQELTDGQPIRWSIQPAPKLGEQTLQVQLQYQTENEHQRPQRISTWCQLKTSANGEGQP
ncbi:MAG: type II secretion system protein [Planctomycetaceae bacterium]|nr:type II secretion system protein [Planctomycetaceae bacterium]